MRRGRGQLGRAEKEVLGGRAGVAEEGHPHWCGQLPQQAAAGPGTGRRRCWCPADREWYAQDRLDGRRSAVSRAGRTGPRTCRGMLGTSPGGAACSDRCCPGDSESLSEAQLGSRPLVQMPGMPALMDVLVQSMLLHLLCGGLHLRVRALLSAAALVRQTRSACPALATSRIAGAMVFVGGAAAGAEQQATGGEMGPWWGVAADARVGDDGVRRASGGRLILAIPRWCKGRTGLRTAWRTGWPTSACKRWSAKGVADWQHTEQVRQRRWCRSSGRSWLRIARSWWTWFRHI